MFEVPPLPYSFDALEPHIDAKTMEIHHDKHHAAYVSKLNAALEGHEGLQKKKVEEILRDINSVPEGIRTAVRNHGGGHANHSLFWEIMGPGGGGNPSGQAAQAIQEAFGSFESLKEKVNNAATNQFGSGWGWLVLADGKLDVIARPNQDSPLMEGKTPILGVDVWEHAYYLKYQNRRPDYLNAWWSTINWSAVEQRLAQARG
ncbi:MAG: superoxide dismutase, Fe-Mn family [Acidobacteriota bacterium]|jgi:Fe-Mn family superoxide dismutase|nr:superoxide dismutase, Fe-Mn family [Acidobacteriota bacterium]